MVILKDYLSVDEIFQKWKNLIQEEPELNQDLLNSYDLFNTMFTTQTFCSFLESLYKISQLPLMEAKIIFYPSSPSLQANIQFMFTLHFNPFWIEELIQKNKSLKAEFTNLSKILKKAKEKQILAYGEQTINLGFTARRQRTDLYLNYNLLYKCEPVISNKYGAKVIQKITEISQHYIIEILPQDPIDFYYSFFPPQYNIYKSKEKALKILTLLTKKKMFSSLLDFESENILSEILVNYKHMQGFKNFCLFFKDISQMILQKSLQEKDVNQENDIQYNPLL